MALVFLENARILVSVYYYMLVTLQVMVGAKSHCGKSDPLTWSISKQNTTEGASFHFDHDFVEICRIRIEVDLNLWNDATRKNLTISANGVILKGIALEQFSSDRTKNNITVHWPYYDTKPKFNCFKCVVSVNFGKKYAWVATRVEKIAIRSAFPVKSDDNNRTESTLKDCQLLLNVGIVSILLIVIGLSIPIVIVIRKRRTSNKPSDVSIMSQEKGLDESTYSSIFKCRVNHDGIDEPVYADCQPYRNRNEQLYADASSTSRPNRPRKQDDEIIYCQVEIVNLPTKKIAKTTLEDTVYAKLT